MITAWSKNYKKLFGFRILICIMLVFSWSQGFRRQKEYCSLLSKCGLPFLKKDCPDSLCTGIEGVEYDSTRCGDTRKMVESGISVSEFLGQKLYGFLGQKYRVVYEVSDSLPVKPGRFEYLLDDIPLAAKVVNAFRKTDYHVVYLDGEQKRYWRGRKGKNLSGEATLIAGSIAEKKLTYFGFGDVKILKWKLRGQIYFDYVYAVHKDKMIAYNLKVVAFPANAVVNFIMNIGMFKKIATNKIIEVFTDITKAGNELDKLSYEDFLKIYEWTEEDKKKLRELIAI